MDSDGTKQPSLIAPAPAYGKILENMTDKAIKKFFLHYMSQSDNEIHTFELETRKHKLCKCTEIGIIISLCN